MSAPGLVKEWIRERKGYFLDGFSNGEEMRLGELRDEVAALIAKYGENAWLCQDTTYGDCDEDVDNLTLAVEIEREETDAEAVERQLREANRAGAERACDLAKLAELKAKYEGGS